MSKKEQSRLMVLNGIEAVKVAAREAAEVIGLSLRYQFFSDDVCSQEAGAEHSLGLRA